MNEADRAVEKNLFVELHALVSHAPSNLNRDDLGAPKTAVFGGVRRLRISSQCQKRSWRLSDLFRQEFAAERDLLGERTNQLGEIVVGRLGEEKKLTDEERRGFTALLESLGKKESATEEKETKGQHEDDSTETRHLLYLSQDEQAAVAAFVEREREALGAVGTLLKDATSADAAKAQEGSKAEEKAAAPEPKAGKNKRKAKGAGGTENPKRKDADEKIKTLRKALTKHLLTYVPRSAVDVALFGRFLTESEFREIDAAIQVAHALGTQKADVEYDYFTAMDDRSKEAAADHIGETELGASVFYKYAACDMALLRENLGPSEAEAKQAEKHAKDGKDRKDGKDGEDGNKDEARKKVEAHRVSAREVAARALKAIAYAMARVVPTGKKNSTAPQSPADYLEVVVRRDAPVSLANAFLKPVVADRDRDVMDVSIEELRRHANTYDRMYGADGVVARFVLSSRLVPTADDKLDQKEPRPHALPANATQVDSLKMLGDKLEQSLLKELPA